MDTKQQTGNDQATLWNGRAAQGWIGAQESIDRMYQPFERMLVEAIAEGEGKREVLDIGCGAGATTLAIARELGAEGQCMGIDISEPMIAAARARADREGARAQFLCADAQDYPFGAASFDAIVSRFGVMFFADPVRAFANLRRATREGGELRVIAWRGPAENPFMTTAERAAAPMLPQIPPRRPDAPGQFGFADDRRVRRILEESGWTEVAIRAIDVECVFPERELVRYFTTLGPVGLALGAVDEGTRAQVIEKVREAFEPYVHGEEVRYTAACWMISGRA